MRTKGNKTIAIRPESLRQDIAVIIANNLPLNDDNESFVESEDFDNLLDTIEETIIGHLELAVNTIIAKDLRIVKHNEVYELHTS